METKEGVMRSLFWKRRNRKKRPKLVFTPLLFLVVGFGDALNTIYSMKRKYGKVIKKGKRKNRKRLFC